MNGKKSLLINLEQQAAIEYGDGPLLIIAGAGTGKTTVVTQRINHLVMGKKVPPSNILALTFTEKAAKEMEERVDVALPYGYTQMWISTFHSFCDRVLKNEAIHIGLNPGYRLLTQSESIALFRRNIFSFDLSYFRPLGNPVKFVYGMLQHISRLQDEDITPGQYRSWVEDQDARSPARKDMEQWRELSRVYSQWHTLKIQESVMEFGDLIAHVLDLFRRRSHVLAHYREQFMHILVDEFQDTNIAQYELIKLLAPASAHPNLAVVGDDSQSIYKFRGAAISNILSFQQDYTSVRQVLLHRNYRSSQAILDASYRLIKHNDPDTLEARLGINKQLHKVRDVPEVPVEFMYNDRVEDEAEQAVSEIAKLHETYAWKDITILVRANNHADPFIRSLQRQGIPYQFLGPGMLFKQKEVRDLVAYLKVLNNIDDAVSLYRVLTMDRWDVPARDVAVILNFSRKYNTTLFESMEIIGGIIQPVPAHKPYQLPFISEKGLSTVTMIVSMVSRHLSLVPKETAGQILYYFLEDSGMVKELTTVSVTSDERRVQNISRFFDKLKSFETVNEDASVGAVIDWIDLASELGESPLAAETDWAEHDAVTILTVHSSKGLEFPVVFLPHLIVGRFPTYNRREQVPLPDDLIKEVLPEGDFHVQEERRLFYVGMTRAKDRLYVTASKFYSEGGKRERKISPFVIEALGNQAVGNKKTVAGNKQLSFLDYQKHDVPGPSQQEQIQRTPISNLSYSQIDTFNLCPLKYKFRYILKIPVPASSAASFGQSVHESLRAFYRQVQEGKQVIESDLVSQLDTYWIPWGYSSRSHENRTKEQGRHMLKEYFKHAFIPGKKPVSLEQFFMVRLNPSLRITGKIDRIDEHNGVLEVIDYKTGKVPSKKDIDESLQMTMYALAVTDKGVFGRDADRVVLSFYFLQDQEKISTTRTVEQVETARKELVSVAEKIRASSFAPTPGRHCNFCEFRPICPAWEE